MRQIYKIYFFFLFSIITFNVVTSRVPCFENYSFEYSRNYKGNYGILYDLNCFDPNFERVDGDLNKIINEYTNYFQDKNIPSYYFTNPGYTIYNFHPSSLSNSNQFSISSTFIHSTYPNSSLIIQSFFFKNASDISDNITKTMVDYNNCASLKYDQCVLFINFIGKAEPTLLFEDNLFRPFLINGNPNNGTYYIEISRISLLPKSSYNIYLFSNSLKYEAIYTFQGLKYTGQVEKSEILPVGIYHHDPISYINFGAETKSGNIGSLIFRYQNDENFDLVIPPPFSFTLSNGIFNYILAYPVSKYFKTPTQFSFSFTNDDSFFPTTNGGGPILPDNQKPTIVKVDFLIPLEYSDNIAIRVTASDKGSGVQFIILKFYSTYSLKPINPIKLSNMDLVKGDCFNGVYQVIVPKYKVRKYYEIEIIDHANNPKNSNDSTPFLFLTPFDFQSVFFASQSSDVSENCIKNTMFIELKNKSIDFLVFEFIPIFGVNNEPSFTSKWDSSISLYEIHFTIPARLPPGSIQYILNPVDIDSSTFYSYLGPSSELNIISEKTDTIGPLVTSLLPYNPESLSYGKSVEVGFDIYFEDNLNGIADINFTISSDKYNNGFDFNCKPPVITNNYICSPRWNVTISQTFYITKMSTIDTKGYSTEYPNINKVNPMMKIVETNFNKLIVKSTGENDTSIPTLVNFTCNKSLIKNQSDRSFLVNFTIEDTISGVSIQFQPILYTISDTLKILSFPCQHEKGLLNNTKYHMVNFYCQVMLPYLYGYPNGFFFQIHGIYDNDFNVAGFNYENTQRNDFFINVTLDDDDKPFIESFKTDESYITLKGFKFGISPTVVYKFSFIQDLLYFSPSPFLNNSFIQFKPDLNQSVTGEIISIYITTPEGKSNTVLIELPCKGEPLCGDQSQGVCTLMGCRCKPEYSGIDCSSKIIIVDPKINTTKPDAQFPYTQYQSLVSVHSLREVDYMGTLVNEYIFNNWSYYGSNDSFSFTTDFDNKNKPNNSVKVDVLIRHFKDGGLVEFAGKNVPILMGAVKYYFSLSNYIFKSQLNTLHLVMYAGVETLQKENVCFGSEFGVDSLEEENQYFKVQINDFSLYGQFMTRAIIDGKFLSIRNLQLNFSDVSTSLNTNTHNQVFFAIEIPNYKIKAELDPNFSILLESTNKQNSQNRVCVVDNSKSGMTSLQIMGIIISCVGMFVVIVVIVGYFSYKKSTLIRIKTRFVSLKLKSLRG
ncbi:hypothetical protein ACTFIZ_012310 [Dictyostelium cf. discoideum]